jgi:CrcB protein
MEKIALIGIFGAAGAVARYSVSGWVYRVCGESFPYGTLAVNLIGCFLLGAVAHITQNTELIRVNLRDPVRIGMLGAFTTFSTFGYDTLQLLELGRWWLGLLNVLLSVLVGIFAVWLGIALARQYYGGA